MLMKLHLTYTDGFEDKKFFQGYNSVKKGLPPVPTIINSNQIIAITPTSSLPEDYMSGQVGRYYSNTGKCDFWVTQTFIKLSGGYSLGVAEPFWMIEKIICGELDSFKNPYFSISSIETAPYQESYEGF